MIYQGSKIKLLPNTEDKDGTSNEKNEKWEGINHFGHYFQFKVLDKNLFQKKMRSGFIYLQVFTELDLHAGDVVTIKKLLYAGRKDNIVILGVEIMEQPESTVEALGTGSLLDYGF